MLKIILSAARLDVVELLPDVSDPHLFYRPEPRSFRERLQGRSRIWRLCMFLRRAFDSMRRSAAKLPDLRDSTFFVEFSVNQRRALEPIYEELVKNNIPTCIVDARLNGDLRRQLDGKAHLWALPFLPAVLLRMFAARGFRWKSFTWGIDRYWLAYGAYIVARRLFRNQRPKALVVSNDHIFWPRILIAAARDESIPSIYVQHAPVTERFPALTMDYALLDGQHSLKLYANAGKSATHVYLVGMPRLDPHVKKINVNDQARSVAFCFGSADSLDRATELLRHLATQCPGMRYVIRLHPRTNPKTIAYWQDLCQELKAEFSDSRNENPFELLSRVDIVIAGGSGIILEAALLNVTPIMYELTPGYPDWYGFARDGLCSLLTTPEEVSHLLAELSRHRPQVRSRSKYYCETVDTPFEGKSAELAAGLIHQIGDGAVPESSPWRPIEDSTTLLAFRIASDLPS